jgi:hypothetical protein
MRKLVRIVDFQVSMRSDVLAARGQRSINETLFATYEPIRLWLKEHEIKAPFRKIVVSVADGASFARWHGNVSNAIGICEVTEAMDVTTITRKAGDHQWVLGVVEHALGCIAQNIGWRSDELDACIKVMSKRTLPLIHFFERLAQVDDVSGVRCVPWLSTRPGETQIGVHIVTKASTGRDVTILSKSGPLYLEDSFPVAKSAMRRSGFVLLDKAGKILATVPIDGPEPH